ncbi:conserved hypothetical protein [Uncinocarpus reesii 1704]|uniref:ER membrane protein complex subunit 1 n=1 Tax=Uncinocarpus reesii (strain UAMH 1704) TaxID=336963 RepID=C4JLQ4_UNCRE|nr:uncharacterized protein UREG_03762 [Uncinocarpus reesii 1704]EEP78916.1 conserved hypothetical protein [Uncinocarpus reesii 1704]
MRLQVASLFLASVVRLACAVIADEAYQIDYHHALLGTPQAHTTFFHRPSSSSGASLLYSLSEKSILGAVNPKDGSIVWRQNLTEYSAGAGLLRAVDGEDAVISALGSDVSAWGASDGKLLWTKRFNDDASVTSLELTKSHGADLQAVRDPHCVIWGSNPRCEKVGRDNLPFRVSITSTAVYYVSLQPASRKGYKISVVELDIQLGRVTNQYTLHSENELASPNPTIFVSSNAASSFIAWLDQEFKILKVNLLGSKSIHTFDVENHSGETVQDVKIHTSHSVPHFVVYYNTATKSWADVFHSNVKSGWVSKAFQLPVLDSKSASASNTANNQLYFARITRSTVDLFSSTAENILGTWKIKGNSGELEHAVLEVVARGSGFALRFAQVDDSGDWALIRNGELEWRRPESLSDAIVAAWAEVNGGEALAHELEFEGHQDALSAYIHRVKRHAKALQDNLFPWLQELPTKALSSFSASDGTELTQFGFGKLVVVATRKGRILALDSARQGAVLWNVKAAEGAGTWGANAISAHQNVATIFVKDGSTVKVNITSGDIIERSQPTEKYSSMAFISDAASPIPVPIDADGTPLNSHLRIEGDKFLVTLSKDGKLMSWNTASLEAPAWEFVPPKNQKIIHATARPTHDPVASIGKVLGDRSVLYKYLNPNIALVSAVAGSTLTLYLLDGTSGRILHTATQGGVDITQPIASVISENWFAYSFWGDVTDTSDAKGYRLVISELYESPIPNDRGLLGNAANYSNIHSSIGLPRPHVISQAYMIPEAISNMAVTETRQGITIRQLLCTLPDSNAIVGIPRFVLDPRRPVNRDPTSQEVEEGLARYTPFLGFDPQWYLNHAREVMGINRIESSPTLLESSTLIFAYGFDVFGTRLAPSQPFDLLGKGFSRIQLLLTVVALAVGVAILGPMVRRKQVNLQWKA